MSVDVYYYSFSQSRADEQWSYFVDDILAINNKSLDSKNTTLNERQEKLSTYLDYSGYEAGSDEKELLNSLKILDLYCGSIVNEPFEDPKLVNDILGGLINIFNLQTEDGTPTKDEWIRLFNTINKDKIIEASRFVCVDDSEYQYMTIYYYLKYIRPVIKDLKETPDSIFIIDECDYICPKYAELLLLERAKKHLADEQIYKAIKNKL